MIDIKRFFELTILKLRNEATLDQLDELARMNEIMRGSSDVNDPMLSKSIQSNNRL